MASAAAPADQPLLPVGNHPVLVLGVMTAALMQVLDMTIANVAIPHMQSALGATPDTVSWVLTSYIVASAIAMPLTGWLADRIGSRRLFLISVALFVAASMLCGVAQNLEQMVLFRALQGIGGAFMAPLSQSTLLDTTRPSKQPQILAIWGMGILIGPIIGPVLGGYLTETLTWRWVFFVNVPVGIVCLALLLAELPARPIHRRAFDMFGFAMIASMLCALQLLLDRGSGIDWYASAEAWIYTGIIISAAWMVAIHLATAPQPLFDRRLFTDVNFVVSFFFLMLVGATMFGSIALLPPMLQSLFGYDVIDTGLVMMPRGIGVLIAMQFCSRLLRWGLDSRWLVTASFLVVAWSMHAMSSWSLDVDQWHIISIGFVQGIGIGMGFMPLNAMAFSTLPARLRTDGSSLLNLSRSLGSSVGISVVVTLAARGMQTNHAELAEYVTPNLSAMTDLSSLDRFGPYGDIGLAMANGEVTRQAAMIAYLNDFWLMGWVCIAAVPLVLLLRPPKRT